MIIFTCTSPNVAVEWLTILLCIWEVPSSNLSLGYRLSWLRFFVVFSAPPGNWRDSTLKLGHRFLPNPLQFIIIDYHHLVAEKTPWNIQPTHVIDVFNQWSYGVAEYSGTNQNRPRRERVTGWTQCQKCGSVQNWSDNWITELILTKRVTSLKLTAFYCTVSKSYGWLPCDCQQLKVSDDEAWNV
jgi:hypothetical protein